MNVDKYIEVIQRKVVEDMERAFPNGGGIFQQDLDPCHTAKKSKQLLKKITSRSLTGQEIRPL